MSWMHILFGFSGRINRGKYWLAALIYGVVTIAYTVALFAAIGPDPGEIMNRLTNAVGLLALGGVLFLVVLWSSIAVGIKRLHDRNKSGWWMLVFYVLPGVISSAQNASDNSAVVFVSGIAGFAISVWAFVELGCLRGTVGPNRFGADPLMPAQAILRPA